MTSRNASTERACIFCGGPLPTSLQARDARFCSANHRNAFTSGARRVALELLEFGMITADQVRRAAEGEPVIGHAIAKQAVETYLAMGPLTRVTIESVRSYVSAATGAQVHEAVLASYVKAAGFKQVKRGDGGNSYVRSEGAAAK